MKALIISANLTLRHFSNFFHVPLPSPVVVTISVLLPRDNIQDDLGEREITISSVEHHTH